MPGTVGLALDALGDLTRKVVGQVGLLLGTVSAPLRMISCVAELAAAIRPAARSSLSGPIGTARRYHVARVPLPAVKRIAKAYGATVNDVVLTAISAGLRAMLISRGERPEPRMVRTLVPVSVRASGELDDLDNRISLLLPFLPVDIADPVEALAEVHRRLAREKATGEAEAGQAVTALAGREPFAPVSLAIRFAARLPQRSIVTVTTNVPGPRAPLHVLDRKVLALLPYVPIAVRMRLGVAVMTYCDDTVFGVTADYATMPDAGLLTDAIERTVADLASTVDTRARRLNETAEEVSRCRTGTTTTPGAGVGSAP
jgi:diacylglycerol O-acyltransferase